MSSEVEIPLGFIWTYPAAVDSVYDGDTVVCHVLIHPGEGGELHDTHVRVEGINAPELNTAAGKEAAVFASSLLPPGTQIMLVSHKRDKYGRFLARIIIRSTGQDFSDLMVKANHAVPYMT